MNDYDDIINLPHYVSSKRIPMSLENRSAQFAPFSALSGYSESIKETSRLTEKKVEISEDKKIVLNNKLQLLNDNIKNNIEVNFTYFNKDKNKSGGKYITKKGIIKKIDLFEGNITLTDKTKIPINDIIDISSNLFKNIYE